jgi:hypothetical protein
MSRPGQLHDGVQRLKRATAELQRHWVETRQQWDDQSARTFEADHLEALMPTLRFVLSATGELDDFCRKAVVQCQDQDRMRCRE